MKSAIILFPGTNRERDMAAALKRATGREPQIVWHGETTLPPVDLIVLPGGFSFGDYLRSGAIAARSPIMPEVAKRAADGVLVLGVCNGFQTLCEAGLLPGVLMRNASLKFVCREVKLEVVNTQTPFTRGYRPRQVIRCPVAHADGNYFADEATLDRLENEGRVVFRYAEDTNPERLAPRYRRHPERRRERARHDAASGGPDGRGAGRPRRAAAVPGARRRLRWRRLHNAKFVLLAAVALALAACQSAPKDYVQFHAGTGCGDGRQAPRRQDRRVLVRRKAQGVRGLFLCARSRRLRLDPHPDRAEGQSRTACRRWSSRC